MDQNLLLFCDSMTNLLYGLFSFDLIIILLKKKKHHVLWNLFILAFDVLFRLLRRKRYIASYSEDAATHAVSRRSRESITWSEIQKFHYYIPNIHPKVIIGIYIFKYLQFLLCR